MAFGIYIHIPYCLQRCRYCDFTTFEWGQILPPDQYVGWVREEIRRRRHWPFPKVVDTVYFGGGTPSLIDAHLSVALLEELDKSGFSISPDAEITIEINPATLDAEKIRIYREGGVNRFSVGAQTFDDALLKMCGRKHSAQDTRDTLNLLREKGFNYSFDLLFALPGQSLAGVEADVREALTFDPPHLSAYCLTVPEGHPMAQGRAPEDDQVAMFEVIEEHLARAGLAKYEISNFARPGFESRHNLIYWTDQAYWGLGVSAHSYLPAAEGGMRFWNPKNLAAYGEQAAVLEDWSSFPREQKEQLKLHELMTDYCHIHLRLQGGLSKRAVRQRFPDKFSSLIARRMVELVGRGLIEDRDGHWRLTKEGQILSNQVFSELTFLAMDTN